MHYRWYYIYPEVIVNLFAIRIVSYIRLPSWDYLALNCHPDSNSILNYSWLDIWIPTWILLGRCLLTGLLTGLLAGFFANWPANWPANWRKICALCWYATWMLLGCYLDSPSRDPVKTVLGLLLGSLLGLVVFGWWGTWVAWMYSGLIFILRNTAVS